VGKLCHNLKGNKMKKLTMKSNIAVKKFTSLNVESIKLDEACTVFVLMFAYCLFMV